MVKAIEWINGKTRILDQTRLPLEIRYIDCETYLQVAECIKNLCIRGAPAIGIAAAMGVALASQEIKARNHDEFKKALDNVMVTLLKTRPTAVNIQWAIQRMMNLMEKNRDVSIESLKALILKEAQSILKEDIEINRSIGKWGAQFIKDGDRILTHCNAGSLATGGYGTATAPIRVAIEQGKKIQVIADETRPVLQGARLTAWELMEDNIPVTLITDNTAGTLMKSGKIDLCIVGTDRTVKNGDVANKIGTYTVAVLAKENNIPFYVAAPLSSIDFSLASGEMIPIEERPLEEVTTIFHSCRIAPQGVKVRNIAFDVTPARFITAIFTEIGAFRPEDIHLLEEGGNEIDQQRIKP